MLCGGFLFIQKSEKACELSVPRETFRNVILSNHRVHIFKFLPMGSFYFVDNQQKKYIKNINKICNLVYDYILTWIIFIRTDFSIIPTRL